MTRTEAKEALQAYTMEASALASRIGIEADEFTLHESVYWFCARNYEGQGCDLYAILCVSEYKPGPFVTFEKLPEETRDIVEALESGDV